MIRVLFVDDEARILTGIENALLFADHELTADFANSGEEALALLDAKRYDVIVTDMKMPGLNGADVLERTKARHPDVVRVILSGEVEPDLAERAMPLTHEFVSKPCAPEHLFDIIDRVHQATLGLGAGSVRDVVAALERLPTQPDLHLRLQEAIDRGADADSLAGLIESDLAIAATVVKTANFAFYGFRTPVENVRDAVVRLGTDTVGGIVLNAEVARWTSPEVKHLVHRLNAHSTRIADLCRRLLYPGYPHAALAGLLHDIGELVLLSQFAEPYRELLESLGDDGEPQAEAERRVFGASHAEIGAALLELWNADPLVVQVARHHHDPHVATVGPDAWRMIEAITASQLTLEPEAEAPPPDPELLIRAQELVIVADRKGWA